MPTRTTKQNELVQLQYEITNEIARDAKPIAQGVFGNNARHPDMASISNAELDQLYRDAYARGDRKYLMQEAQRDPQQFLAVTDRLGVPDPTPDMHGKPSGPDLSQQPQDIAQSLMTPPVQAPQAQPMLPPAAPVAAPMAPPQMVQPPLPGMPPPGQPIPAMASGGIVTQPTLALIGEAGPEAVVPLSPDPDLSARLGNVPGPDVTPGMPSHDEIAAYIMQAARQRGIDPSVALNVALHEGTNPQTGRFDSPAVEGRFPTGRSWWPFQLHYGGAGTPYAQYGDTAGMGNDFTRDTGWQPGDPRAWRDATDYALDQAIANPRGWALWYGSKPAKVAPRQGLPSRKA